MLLGNTKHLFIQLLISVAILCGLYIFSSTSAFAQTASVSLTVNGGPTANIVFGNSVLLEWYAVGVSNCSINNGVGAIPDSELPSGSRSVTPEVNTSYTMTCSGGSDAAVVTINPTVSLVASPAGPLTTNLQGYANLTVSWTSEFATECGRLSYTTESGSTHWLNVTSDPKRVPDYGKTEGSQTYNRWPNNGMRESATFRLTCRNAVTGASGVGTVYVEVNQPTSIPDPTVTISADRESVVPNVNLGYGQAKITTATEHTTYCNRYAYDAQGSRISVPGWTNTWSGVLNSNNTVNISTTTRFTAVCGRGIDGKSVTSNSVTIQFEGTDVELAERTLTLTAPASLVITDLLLGTVQGTVSYDARPTGTWCNFSAFDSTGASITVPNWSNLYGGHMSRTINNVTFATTTQLEIRCWRNFDNSLITATATVAVSRVDQITLAEQSVRVSGYRETILSGDFSNRDNYVINGSLLQPQNTSQVAVAKADFIGRSGTYDVYVQYCDEFGSQPQFTFTSANANAQWTADQELSRSNCDSQTLRVKQVAAAVPLEENEEIEISCTTNGSTSGQPCRFGWVRFLDTTSEVEVPINSDTGLAEQSIVWQGENVTFCNVRQASTIGGVTYSFSNHAGVAREEYLNNIATTTTFQVVCGRTGDSKTAEGQFTVVPLMPQSNTPLEEVAEIFVGECIDRNLIIVGSGGGAVTPIPPGYAADSANDDTCILNPADLFVANYGASPQSEWVPNSDTGTYDDVELRLIFTNRGPGEFLAPVSYRFDIQYNTSDIVNFTPNQTSDIKSHTPQSLMLAGHSSPILRVFSNVPFGTHLVRARINQDPQTIYEGDSAAYDDNTIFYTLNVPPPTIPMSLTVDRTLIHRGQTATLLWGVSSGYPVSCKLLGPGINEYFDLAPEADSVVAMSDTRITNPIMNSTRFSLTCSEASTNTVFVRTAEVKVVPTTIEQ